MVIESSANGQIKRIKKLKKSARSRRDEGLFVAEGWKITEEAVRHGLAQAVYVADSARKKQQIENLLAKLQENDSVTDVEILSDALFDTLSDTVTPQGILTLVKIPVYSLGELTAGEDARILVLEDIQDPGNLGTMIRTAEGAGMSGVLLSKGCVDLFNPKVVRATMGALFRVPYVVSSDLTTDVELLKHQGFSLYAAHPDGSEDFTEPDYGGRAAVLIGNEANGLSEKISALADRRVRIPMEGELESLNAAVSAALFMYEMHRRR